VFAILGSGFGLYGYLPALVDAGERIVLPERYRARFAARPELAFLATQIQWAASEKDALARADGVVLALRPADQCEWLPRCLAYKQITRLVLEKPLAPTPDAAASVLDSLKNSGKTFRIGYTFPRTNWATRLASLAKVDDVRSIAIDWTFMAHHFRHDLQNWKRSSGQGGGAIRFYGIQAIALLAELGYRDVVSSTAYGSTIDEPERWVATFAGGDLPVCHLAIDSRAMNTSFRVGVSTQSGPPRRVTDQQDPFDFGGDEVIRQGLDRRVDILAQLSRSLIEAEPGRYDWYDAVVALWRVAEVKLEFHSASGK